MKINNEGPSVLKMEVKNALKRTHAREEVGPGSITRDIVMALDDIFTAASQIPPYIQAL